MISEKGFLLTRLQFPDLEEICDLLVCDCFVVECVVVDWELIWNESLCEKREHEG